MQDSKENIIIQCPECNTKFSLAKEVLLKTKSPQFHCSKCDNVFTVSKEELFPSLKKQNKSNSIGSTDGFVISSKEEEERKQKIMNDDVDYNDDFYNENKSNFQKNRTSAFLKNENYNISNTKDDYNISSKFQDEEETEEIINNKNHDFENDTLNSWLNKKANDFANTFNLQKDDEDESIFEEEDTKETKDFYIKEKKHHQWEDEGFSPTSKKKQKYKKETIVPQKQVRLFRSVLNLSFVFSLFLIVLCFAGFYLKSNKDVFEKLDINLFSAGKLPPSGVILKNINIYDKTLSSEEDIKLITGKIVNDSNVAISDVILESILFDKDDNIVDIKKTTSASRLGEYKTNELLSLSASIIDDFQKSQSRDRLRISPGEQLKFAVAFTDKDKIKNARKFAIRIYSSKYKD